MSQLVGLLVDLCEAHHADVVLMEIPTQWHSKLEIIGKLRMNMLMFFVEKLIYEREKNVS